MDALEVLLCEAYRNRKDVLRREADDDGAFDRRKSQKLKPTSDFPFDSTISFTGSSAATSSIPSHLLNLRSHHASRLAAKMSAIAAQIHIDTSPFPASNQLPTTPIPLTNPTSTTLAPSTELRVPIPPHDTTANDKPQQLSDLADAMDATRASLNQVLTVWKDWAGKEGVSKANQEDEAEDEEEEEEE